MVVVEGIPGVEITIHVDGQTLKEYTDDEESGLHTASRYVESVTGKDFTIRVEVTEAAVFRGDTLVFDVYIDGEYAVGQCFQNPGTSETYIFKGFCFTALQIVDDGTLAYGKNDRVKTLGAVKVLMHQVEDLGSGPVKRERTAQPHIGDLGVFTEKDLKGQALSHSAGYTRSRAVSTVRNQLYYLDGRRYPAATFVLRYRSLESLKSLLIIKPPIPLEERDFESLSPEEMKEYHKITQARLRADKAAMEADIKPKREREDDSPRPRKKARPTAGATVLELDEDGTGFREVLNTVADGGSTEPEIVSLD